MIKSNEIIKVTYNGSTHEVHPVYLTESYVVSHDVSDLLVNISSNNSVLSDTCELTSDPVSKVTILGNSDIVTILIEDQITTDVEVELTSGTLVVRNSTLINARLLTVISLCYSISVPYDEALTKRVYNLLTSNS